MEPFTHFLTGACIGRAGLNRKTAYATMAAVLAAEAADLDIFWSLAGPVKELQHHRGFTHTFLGALVVALVVASAIWAFHFLREKQKARKAAALKAKVEVTTPAPDPVLLSPAAGPVPVPHQSQPARWQWVFGTALIAALSHLLLDWMNNYGVRPFYPFSGRWYAGNFLFIVEPSILIVLALALIMPWLFGLADREIGARRKPFRGRGWAIFALAAFAALAGLRWWQHDVADSLARNAAITLDPVERIAAEPYPWNPFRWHVLVETPSYYQTAEVNTWVGSVDTDPKLSIVYKPAVTPAVEAAKRTYLGSVYLDWSKWPVVQDLGPEPAPGMDPPQLTPGRTFTAVRFSDLRFHYSILGDRVASDRSPLTGWVYIVGGREDAGEAMDGSEQR